MTGRSHREMGIAYGWCTALAGDLVWRWSVPAAFGVGLVLSVLASVAVMWPDLDHTQSTATHRSWFWVSDLVQGLALRMFHWTATDLDWSDPDCRRLKVHRGVTHSAFVGLFVGALIGSAVGFGVWWLGGPWLTVGLLLFVGVGGGMGVHGYGDAWTSHGCAFAWPLVIKGRRYYPVRVPRLLRMRTGQRVEPALVPWLSGLTSVAAILALIPGAWLVLLGYAASVADQLIARTG